MGRGQNEFSKVGRAVMIDAATFANLYNAFWKSVAPTCDLYVRRLNRGESERFDTPLSSSHSAARSALLAEAGFAHFALRMKVPILIRAPANPLDEALEDSRRRLRVYERLGLDLDSPLTQDERRYTLEISRRLEAFFTRRIGAIAPRPVFQGCGFVDVSEGDVMSGRVLFEVKSVDRGIRSADIYQLITYCSLAVASGGENINALGLVNPRRGIFVEMGIDEIAREIAGISAADLINQVITTISSGDISR